MIKSFNGKKPRIAQTALVSDGAYILGDVIIGENSSIWPGVVIRADFDEARIGSNVHIEDNTVCHGGPLVIGDNVQIGHGAIIDGPKIGSHVLIGNNATVLVDAEIGDYCLIGANALVRAGMKVPSGSFVIGVPAKIKGEISEKQLALIEEKLTSYAALVKRYKEQGF